MGVSVFKMLKSVVLISLAVLASVAQAQDDGCDSCREGIELLWEFGSSEANLEREEALLIATVCPQMEDSRVCDIMVAIWWPRLSKAIFSEREARRVCHALDENCGFQPPSNVHTRKWNCEKCQAEIERVAKEMSTQEAAQIAIDMLDGALFCHNPEWNANPEQIVQCEVFVREFVPLALPTVFGVINKGSEKACSAVYDNICG